MTGKIFKIFVKIDLLKQVNIAALSRKSLIPLYATKPQNRGSEQCSIHFLIYLLSIAVWQKRRINQCELEGSQESHRNGNLLLHMRQNRLKITEIQWCVTLYLLLVGQLRKSFCKKSKMIFIND